jgi:hypothetical protein
MTNTKSLPSIDYLRKRLRYEPETGKLFWLDYEGMPNSWRAKWVGKEAFAVKTDKGYLCGRVDGVLFKAHRIAWVMYYGELPSDQIDHINGVKGDNRISNLRVVNNQENQRNSAMRRDNTSGITGVVWNKANSHWRATIRVDNHLKNLGSFSTIEEAADARKQADIKYGFTERHGTKVEEVE